MHRRAFRALLRHPATDQECMDYFRANSSAFHAAACAKLGRRRLLFTDAFHLTSRDVSRALNGKVDPS